MDKRKTASIGIVLLISAFFLYLIMSYQPFKEKGKVQPLPKISSDIMLKKAKMIEMEGEKKKWELEADVAEHFTDKKFSSFKDVKVIFYDKEGKPIVLTGKEAKVFTESKDIEVKKDVQVTNSAGYKLNTESLHYNAGSKTGDTRDFVRVDGPELTLTGNGAILDMQTGKISVLNNVRSTFKETKKKKI